jgi:rhamnosyltransferase
VRADVVAVIPVYRPAPVELPALVGTLTRLGVPTVIADDASPCTSDPLLRSMASTGPAIVRHRRNAGIARSLNDGLSFAQVSRARWLLTLDQDSTIDDGYVDSLLAAATVAETVLGPGSVGAVAAGGIADASGPIGYPVVDVHGVPTTHEVIQTGTLWSVDHLVAVGGFDETLGIDAVDAAACLRLRSAGLHVVIAPGVTVGHRIGAGHQVRLLGRSVLSSGHSPERRTTMVRNRLRLFPGEFGQSPTHALRTLRRVAMNTALAVTVEDDRWAKAKGAARGLLPHRKR